MTPQEINKLFTPTVSDIGRNAWRQIRNDVASLEVALTAWEKSENEASRKTILRSDLEGVIQASLFFSVIMATFIFCYWAAKPSIGEANLLRFCMDHKIERLDCVVPEKGKKP